MIKADYIDSMGSDLTVVNAARVSFDKESEWFEECSCGCVGPDFKGCGSDQRSCKGNLGLVSKSLLESDGKLINYLAKHNHWTPFSHCFVTIRETVPIFVARQRFKHMVGFSYNEVSRRYVDDTPEFYYPDTWRGRPTNGAKQGSSDTEIEFIKIFDIYSNDYINTDLKAYYQDYIDDCKMMYEAMIDNGVAPEQARMVLPQSMLTSYYVSGSLAAWARAYKLRMDTHAQKEIRDLAVQWGDIIKPLFPVSWEALAK